MIELAQYPSAALPSHVKYQLLAAVRIEWPWIFTGPDRAWDYTHKDTQPRYFVLTEHDSLVSFAEVNQRVLHVGDEPYQVYGLSAVYTFPAYRREGHGCRIVDTATSHIRASDADVAMLFCLPPMVDFYRASGWQPIPTATIWTGQPEQPKVYTEETLMMLFVSDQGRRHQDIFASQPVYVGSYAW